MGRTRSNNVAAPAPVTPAQQLQVVQADYQDVLAKSQALLTANDALLLAQQAYNTAAATLEASRNKYGTDLGVLLGLLVTPPAPGGA